MAAPPPISSPLAGCSCCGKWRALIIPTRIGLIFVCVRCDGPIRRHSGS